MNASMLANTQSSRFEDRITGKQQNQRRCSLIATCMLQAKLATKTAVERHGAHRRHGAALLPSAASGVGLGASLQCRPTTVTAWNDDPAAVETRLSLA